MVVLGGRLHAFDFYVKKKRLSYRVCIGTHPLHRSNLHFCNVVFARSLPEMCAARHNMVEIACGCCRTYTFCSPGSPTDVSLPGWRPASSAVGWPCATANHIITKNGSGCVRSWQLKKSLKIWFKMSHLQQNDAI